LGVVVADMVPMKLIEEIDVMVVDCDRTVLLGACNMGIDVGLS
jgi:hypothetical protein